MGGVTRRLAAIVAADVAGYSRLIAADEEGTLAALRAHRAELIDPRITEYHGRIANTAGDSILIEFPSVVEALRCAVDVQRGMAERNGELAEDRWIAFRVGINLGDVIEQDGDLLGDGVNVAARLEGLADPGGICLSRAARDQVRDRIEVALEDLGEVEVKNMARPVRVFRVLAEPGSFTEIAGKPRSKQLSMRVTAALIVVAVLAGGGVLAWLEPWRSDSASLTSLLSAKTSIAVLPFSNLSRDPDQEYFSDGITNDLITDLSKFHDLFVIASNSVFTYKGKAVKIQKVGRELGVNYVLEGSVQKLGDRVRINAQLIDAADGKHLWAERYDGATTDLFDLQDRITQNIVGVLAIKLTDIERERASAKSTRDLQAYDYVLKGRHLISHVTSKANFEARELFRKALGQDPDYADAYTGLGRTYLNAFLYGWTHAPGDAIKRTEQLVRRAMSIDPSSVDGYRLRGNLNLLHRQYDLALIGLERAIAINPNDAYSHHIQGVVLVWAGRPDGAINALETALRFDPRMNAEGLATHGLAYYLKERYGDAVTVLRQSAKASTDYLYAHQILTAALGQLGRSEAAAREAAVVRRLDPFFDTGQSGSLFRDPADRAKLVDGLKKVGLE